LPFQKKSASTGMEEHFNSEAESKVINTEVKHLEED